MRASSNWSTPLAHIQRHTPDAVQLYFSPPVLQATAQRFLSGFPGLVTYAIKANASDEVLANLTAAGVTAFDVASPREMAAARAANPNAVLHYNNPVRSPAEIATAIAMNVASWSVDCPDELEKLRNVPAGTEISVRLALPVRGAHYDFGTKFGLAPAPAASLLKQVAARGFTPAITFHPGTQCTDPGAWAAYIETAAQVARDAGVRLARLNVGGGFAAHRRGDAPDLEAVFARIEAATAQAFGTDAPSLVCEPGRAMVAEAFTLGTRVKALRADGSVFLNDGLYGGLGEARDIYMPDRIRVISPEGEARNGTPVPRVVFGPTCDSLDRLPDDLPLPADMVEGDYLLIAGMGAYSQAINTGFNGYGLDAPVTVAQP